MAFDWAGRHVLITGGASGIGLETARMLKMRRASVTLWDINEDALLNAGRELSAQTCRVDVSEPAAVADAMRTAVEVGGSLHGVIHSAAILRTGLFSGSDVETQARMVAVNLTGTIAVAHAALPYLTQTGGALVLLASIGAFYGGPEFATYNATKAAVLSLAQALRIELMGSGVTVTAVCPNFVATPMLDERNRQARLIHARSPLREITTPDRIAAAILRGIERRDPLVIPGWRALAIYRLSRYGAFAAHQIMARAWRNAAAR
jgi:short-subunit dehydrogenase